MYQFYTNKNGSFVLMVQFIKLKLSCYLTFWETEGYKGAKCSKQASCKLDSKTSICLNSFEKGNLKSAISYISTAQSFCHYTTDLPALFLLPSASSLNITNLLCLAYWNTCSILWGPHWKWKRKVIKGRWDGSVGKGAWEESVAIWVRPLKLTYKGGRREHKVVLWPTD